MSATDSGKQSPTPTARYGDPRCQVKKTDRSTLHYDHRVRAPEASGRVFATSIGHGDGSTSAAVGSSDRGGRHGKGGIGSEGDLRGVQLERGSGNDGGGGQAAGAPGAALARRRRLAQDRRPVLPRIQQQHPGKPLERIAVPRRHFSDPLTFGKVDGRGRA